MRVSVITACLNSEETITDTLDSVSSQTHSDVEHIVIDGGSTDDTTKLVAWHKSNNLVLFSEPDGGIYDAMNKGMAKATGEIIGFLNSDDIYADPHVLERICGAFLDSRVDAVYADLVYVTQDNRRIVRYWKSAPFQTGAFARGWCPPHPTFYFRRSLIERLGPFDLNYKLAADMELMLRYLEVNQLVTFYIPSILVRMRVGGASNRSLENIINQNKEIFIALRKHNMKFSVPILLMRKVLNRFCQLLFAHSAGRSGA
jgi:glycosyltransferase involved in cell wall biosynthesis